MTYHERSPQSGKSSVARLIPAGGHPETELGDIFTSYPVIATLCADPELVTALPGRNHGAALRLHLMPSAVAVVEVLVRLGMKPSNILLVCKDYNYGGPTRRSSVEERLRAMGVILADDDSFKEALAAFSVRLGGKDFIVIEDGGLIAVAVYADRELLARCKGFVEQTTKGIWRLQEAIPSLSKTHLSLPASEIKRHFECDFVGDAVVKATTALLAGHAEIRALHTAVLGSAGVIGAAVAEAFRQAGAPVVLYDHQPPRYYALKVHGRMKVCTSLAEALSNRDLIISCTGNTVFGVAELGLLKDGAVLGSTGSERTEFPLRAFERASTAVESFMPPGAVHSHGTVYRLRPDGKRVIVLEEGRPLNLGLAAPDEKECFDLIMGLITAGAIDLMQGRYESKTGLINDFDAIAERYGLVDFYLNLHPAEAIR